MDSENFISLNWKEQVKIFTTNLAICRKRPTKNSVHDLRVAIKRMRSFLRLKKKLTGENWKSLFRNTAALFKSFGRLRDFDMSLTLTKQYERKEQAIHLSLKKHLSANRSLAWQLARQDALNYNPDELNQFTAQFVLTTKEITEKELFEKLLNAVENKSKKVKELDDHFQHHAHEIRKLLKDVYYWLKIVPAENRGAFIDLRKLDKVLNLLGHWQNHFILGEKINSFLEEQPVNKEEKDLLEGLEKKLFSAQDDLLEKARKNWERLVKK
jgi:CHAD domain-containing protein